MDRKLRLDVDSLAVDSFDTHATPAARGTVRGREDDGCTCAASCVCRTAPYYCAPGAYTFQSCHYTRNESCTVQITAAPCNSGEFTCTFDVPC
jgi:hypothetical protein